MAKNSKNIIFLGKVKRPEISLLKFDRKALFYLPRLLLAFKKGDGNILKEIIKIFKENKLNKETNQEKIIKEIDNILDQYIAELINRNIDGSNGFSVIETGLSGFLAHEVHNDKLVQSTYTLVVELDSDCLTGTFTY